MGLQCTSKPETRWRISLRHNTKKPPSTHLVRGSKRGQESRPTRNHFEEIPMTVSKGAVGQITNGGSVWVLGVGAWSGGEHSLVRVARLFPDNTFSVRQT